MRRPVNNRKPVEPELKYSSLLIAKIINKVMNDGKKSTARKIVYDALEGAAKQLEKTVNEVVEKAIENIGPVVELKSRRVGGANYQVPIEVRPDRRLALAIRWMVDSARSGKGKAMHIRLQEEFVNAFNNTGNAVKKRNDVQRMAEANKAFAHLAW